MEAKAHARYTRIPPRKARAVLELIRGRGVEESLRTLQAAQTRGARTITKILNSAVANALAGEGTMKIQSSELFVKAAYANEGPMLRRHAASQGRRLNPQADEPHYDRRRPTKREGE
jgi:large subunit ribosomal protein L22